MPVHSAGLTVTGAWDVVSTDNDPTIIKVQQNSGDEGVDNDEDDDNDNPEDSENDDSDSVDTTPENLLLEDKVLIDEGKQYGVLTDNDETQGGNNQAEGSTFNVDFNPYDPCVANKDVNDK